MPNYVTSILRSKRIALGQHLNIPQLCLECCDFLVGPQLQFVVLVHSLSQYQTVCLEIK